MTVLDISAEALGDVKKRHPEFRTIHADLKAVAPSSQRSGFDLVTSFYCLHHIPRAADFLNGLRFAGRSVAPDGLFLLMDPILSRPYSLFHAMAFRSEDTNGLPRTLSLIDDLLDSEGLERVAIVPAVSFVLNGAVEAGSRLGSAVAGRTWHQLQWVYRRDGLTRRLSAPIVALDRALKKAGKGLSSSLAAYRRIG
jgi:SAM-dependent methyltransferase